MKKSSICLKKRQNANNSPKCQKNEKNKNAKITTNRQHYNKKKRLNDLNRLLDGSALQHYLSTDDFNKDYIILHTVAWGIIGGFLFGNLGALATSSIAFSGLSKPK